MAIFIDSLTDNLNYCLKLYEIYATRKTENVGYLDFEKSFILLCLHILNFKPKEQIFEVNRFKVNQINAFCRFWTLTRAGLPKWFFCANF
jgi:hypothetical protein